ncbi:MAG: transposase [Cytophagaceae bacterium]|nr:transposase [Cytophagaceae bacterium]MDW8456944.1 7TM diverse intracellular signaling domain-containing protein [Cytophagaceae bacterium]
MKDKNEYFLKHYELLEDKNKEWQIGDVTSEEFSRRFVSNSGNLGVNHNLNSAYWIRFTLSDESNQEQNWIIEAFDFKIDHLTLFIPDDEGNYKKYQTGDAFPFKTKYFQHKNLAFVLPLKKHQPHTIYMRIESKEYVVFMFVLRSYNRFVNYALTEYYFFGIFYGIILIIALLNLFLFVTIKDRTYLYYVWYVISVGVFSMTTNGTAFQYLWPDTPKLNLHASSFAALSVVVSALLYSKSFLMPRITAPFIRIVIYTVIILRVVVFVFKLLFDPTELWDPMLDWLALVFAFGAGIYTWYKGFKPSRFYVMAFSVVFIGFLITALNNEGYIHSSNVLVVYSLNIAVVIEIILLSVALADRVNTLKKEKEHEQKEKINQLIKNEELQKEVIRQLQEKEILKDKINKELEEKVRERTLELQAANEEIKRINQLLEAENKKLDSNVKYLSKARVMQKTVSFEEFQAIYSDENVCLEYLANLKWANGYKCEKCGNTNYSKGTVPFSRRCSKCSYIESATANTLFYRLKFSIVKAFYMVFLVSTRPEITADELSEKLQLRRQTCWSFKRKILSVMKKKKRPKNDNDGWSYLILGSEAYEEEKNKIEKEK